MITAEVLADSIYDGSRLVSLKIVIPKFLDAEVEKSRMISSNSSSDRAIPILRMLEQEPYLPPDVRLNQSGMQGYDKPSEEQLNEFYDDARFMHGMITSFCKKHQHIHKQHLNRYLLPFSLQTKVMTANVEQFEYFIFLRDSKYADPSIQILAQKIREAIAGSTPEELSRGEWHLPFVSKEEKQLKDATSISVARCARISYDNFNGYRSTLEQDVELANKLQVSQHWSCFEHQATPIFSLDQITHCDIKGRRFSGNFQNWQQYRQLVTQWNRY